MERNLTPRSNRNGAKLLTTEDEHRGAIRRLPRSRCSSVVSYMTRYLPTRDGVGAISPAFVSISSPNSAVTSVSHNSYVVSERLFGRLHVRGAPTGIISSPLLDDKEPSILRLASCFSAAVGFAFGMSGWCGSCPGE